MFSEKTTVQLLTERLNSATSDSDSLGLLIAEKSWDNADQLDVLTNIRVRYEALADELRLALALFE
jgi:hypothetical protein